MRSFNKALILTAISVCLLIGLGYLILMFMNAYVQELPFASGNVIWPEQGGTGTSTLPTINQLLTGTADGVYTPSSILNVTTLSINSAFTFPTFDGSADQVIITDGSGILSWTDQSSGVTTFLGLTDVPASYLGEGSKYVKVNATEDALEFVDSGLFEVDINGHLMPVTANLTDNYYELDVNDDIMPKS